MAKQVDTSTAEYPLDENINSLEKEKFTKDADGFVAVRSKGESSPSGLFNEGLFHEVLVSNTGWTKLPDVTSQVRRNQLNIQNKTDFEMKINHEVAGGPPTVGYKGMIVEPGEERFYQVTDGIEVYGRMIVTAGAPQIVYVEELS